VVRPLAELRLIELLRSLHDRQVEHVVSGAVALGFYGHVRGTANLDIIVRPSVDNLRGVHDWLVELEGHMADDPSLRFGARQRSKMFRGLDAAVVTKLGQVDVVQKLPGLPGWNQLLADSERYELDELSVAVIARSTLIALKEKRASPQDLADIEAIRLLDRLED